MVEERARGKGKLRMFYISKVSPFIFCLGIFNLIYSVIYKSFYGIDGKFLVLLIYGFICTVIIGAMYQIIPNSQGGKLKHAYISYIVFVGLILFSLFSYISFITISTFFFFISILILLTHLLPTIKNWHPPTVKFLGASLIYLFLSSLLLLLSGFGLINIQTAVHTATVGVLLNAVYGVELAWIPMLTMTAVDLKKANLLFYVKQISTPLFILAFYTLEYKYVGMASLLEIGIALSFIVLVYTTLRKRKGLANVPTVVKVFLYALLLLPVGMILGSYMAFHPKNINLFINLHINVLVYGFAVFTVFGGIFHLLPRIVWNWLYAGKTSTVTISDLVDERGFKTLVKYSIILYPLFVIMDMYFNPPRILPLLIYLSIILLYIKVAFLKTLITIKKEKEHGGNKET